MTSQNISPTKNTNPPQPTRAQYLKLLILSCLAWCMILAGFMINMRGNVTAAVTWTAILFTIMMVMAGTAPRWIEDLKRIGKEDE